MPKEPKPDPSSYLGEIARLLSLAEENPFRVRAFERAAKAVAGREDLVGLARAGGLQTVDGVGKGIAEVLTEYLLKGSTAARDEIRGRLPQGLEELTQVAGVGSKKARTLIAELEIRTLAELEYACRENRLLDLPGFGAKAQAKILEAVVYQRGNQGKRLFADCQDDVADCLAAIREVAKDCHASTSGPLRRRMEILEAWDFLVAAPRVPHALPDARALESLERELTEKKGFPVRIEAVAARDERELGSKAVEASSSPEHWQALSKHRGKSGLFPEPAGSLSKEDPVIVAAERKFYAEAHGLPWIPPEMRESAESVVHPEWVGSVIGWNGLQGVFHVHTTASDGSDELEAMVQAAKKVGFKYVGISDHSQSAYYARGLKPEDLKKQEREVERVRERFPEMRVFWGIESDILADGSLDYPAPILRRFDFVIASVHSRFQMDRDEMTRRLVAAVENPFTTMLGHATGRLLLGRPGYAVDLEKVIRAAARAGTAVEINAHPQRLDLDWRWGPLIRESGLEVSINPDAHAVAGFGDCVHGISVARKALIPAKQVVNSRSAKEVEAWLERMKRRG